MLKIEAVGLSSTIIKLNAQLASDLNLLADELYTEIKKNTPYKTGRARDGWHKTVGKTSFAIDNNVPYIGVLDQGRHMTNRGMRGSKQASRGIIGPSLDSIKRKN